MQLNQLTIILTNMENAITKIERTKLPELKELLDGDLELKEGQNKLNILLNAEPPALWIKEHPMNKKLHYIPIERIEWLLTRLFFMWHIEVKSIQLLANSVVVTVRLFYLDRFSDNYLWQDGIGAAPLQTDSGAGAIEFDKIKNDAVMKAAPAAESYAIKDAAEKIGKIFGKDLNRHDKIMYDALASAFEGIKKEPEISKEEIFADEN